MALDLTVSHGWGASANTGNVTREKWRKFLCAKELGKHLKYDRACADAGWVCGAMALGTWGGLGPEGSRLLHRVIKRATMALEPVDRAAKARQWEEMVGLALFRQVWRLLGRRNFVR